VDSEELVSRLRVRTKVFGGDIEGPRGPGLLLGNVDRPEPCICHSLEGYEVDTFIDHSNVHGLPYLFRLLLSGDDDTPRIRKLNHGSIPSPCAWEPRTRSPMVAVYETVAS